MSTYIFDCQKMLAALDSLDNKNNQNEYYITDLPAIMLKGQRRRQSAASAEADRGFECKHGRSIEGRRSSDERGVVGKRGQSGRFSTRILARTNAMSNCSGANAIRLMRSMLGLL